MRKMTSKENKRTNNIIIACVVCALVMLTCVLVACASTKCSTHDWVIVEDETIQPTCTSNGQITQMCANCRVKKTNAVTELGHNYGAWMDNENGTHSRVCANDSNHVETINCNFVEIGRTPADCENAEVITYQCSISNHTKTEVGQSALSHDWSDWTKLTDELHQRVCQNDSTHIQTADHKDANDDNLCDDCGCVYIDTELPTDPVHVWTEWTSNEDGTHTRTCVSCIESHDETVDCSGGEADCYNGALCDVCGYEYTDALGHDWSEWESNEDGTHGRYCNNSEDCYDEDDCNYVEIDRTPADCENAEIITYQCDVCGHTKTEEGEGALGHDWSAWTSNEDGTHTRVCANDENHNETVDCNYVEIDRTPADCENAEIITYQCDGCGHTKTEEGEGALGHNWSAWNSNEDGTHTRVCANNENHNETVDCNYVVIEDVKVDCEVDGYTVYQCDGCAHSYRVDGEKALGHEYGEWVLDTSGNRTQYCANNGNHKIVEKYIPNTSIDITQGLILVHYVQSALIEDPSNVRLEFVKPVFDKETGETINETTVVTKFTYYTTSTAKAFALYRGA